MSPHLKVPCHAVVPSLRVLSVAELNLLAAATSENPALSDLHTVVKLMANTAIRFGEATRLTWADVDLEKSSAIVRSSKDFYPRVVCFGPKTKQFLVSLRERNPGDTYLLGGASPVRIERIIRKFRVVSKQVGLAKTCLHDLHVSCLVRLSSVGADVQALVHVGGYKGWRFSPLSYSRETSLVYPSQFEEM